MKYLRMPVRKEDASTLLAACQLLDRLQCDLNSNVSLAEEQVIERRAGMSSLLTDSLRIERKALARMDGCRAAREAVKLFLETLVDGGASERRPSWSKESNT